MKMTGFNREAQKASKLLRAATTSLPLLLSRPGDWEGADHDVEDFPTPYRG